MRNWNFLEVLKNDPFFAQMEKCFLKKFNFLSCGQFKNDLHWDPSKKKKNCVGGDVVTVCPIIFL